jgi:hypothetical protein
VSTAGDVSVQGKDIEAQADALEDAARQMAGMLEVFASAPPPRALDPRAVFQGLGRAAAGMKSAAAELRRQEWLDFDDAEEPDMAARWAQVLAGLDDASSLFEEVADGWI